MVVTGGCAAFTKLSLDCRSKALDCAIIRNSSSRLVCCAACTSDCRSLKSFSFSQRFRRLFVEAAGADVALSCGGARETSVSCCSTTGETERTRDKDGGGVFERRVRERESSFIGCWSTLGGGGGVFERRR